MTIAGNSQSTSRPPVAKPRPTYCLESDVSAKQTTEVKKKSKSHRRDVDSVEETPTKALIKKEKKSKKRKREAERPVDEHDLENQEGLEKKVKKRVKRLEENLSDPTITSNVVAPARKRKNKTGFSDPNEDASLPEQSRKCLAYAFLQFHRPSKWKFNKARQNWILRNIWSNEMIPEEHIPLVYGYLAKVQGGVRENLLQSCLTALEKPKVELETTGPADGASAQMESAPTTVPTPSATEATESIKEIRARALMDLLSPSNTSAS